jgi:hypothetical protein
MRQQLQHVLIRRLATLCGVALVVAAAVFALLRA